MDLRVGIVTSIYPSSRFPVQGTFIKDVVDHLRSAGVHVVVINYRYNYAAMSLECMIRSPRLDLLDAQFVAPAGVVAAFTPRLAPFVITVHRWDILEFPYRYPAARFATLAALRSASGIVVVGRTIMSEVTKFATTGSRLALIPNAVDTARFRPDLKSDLKLKLGVPENHKVILSVGHLIPRKGHQYLLHAMFIVLKQNSSCSLVIAGEGPLHDRLDHLIRELGLVHRVKLVGKIDDVILPYYYAMADIFALPSASEGHCVSILEAMSAGRPIVASDIPANAESVVNGKNGFLVPVGNSRALADSILMLLRNNELRQEFGAYSRQRAVKEFGWDNRVNRLVDFYEAVLTQPEMK